MIVTTTSHTSRTLVEENTEIRWRCLARRGMLHSETESVDHLRLAAHTDFDLGGREGIETAWLVVAGQGLVLDENTESAVRAGDVVLAPAGRAVGFRAGAVELELVWLAVLPSALSHVLPERRPVA